MWWLVTNIIFELSFQFGAEVSSWATAVTCLSSSHICLFIASGVVGFIIRWPWSHKCFCIFLYYYQSLVIIIYDHPCCLSKFHGRAQIRKVKFEIKKQKVLTIPLWLVMGIITSKYFLPLLCRVAFFWFRCVLWPRITFIEGWCLKANSWTEYLQNLKGVFGPRWAPLVND